MKYLYSLLLIMFAVLVMSAASAEPSGSNTDVVTSLDAPSWTQGGTTHSLANPGDGIFSPTLSQIASIDKTGRPFTVEAASPEPRFAAVMANGNPTGNSYVMKFPTGDFGGDCTYTGKGRYFIESTGVLTFQIITECGKLKRGYNMMVCMLDQNLHCSQAPWWYFRGRTYAITDQGVVVNGTVYPWNDAANAPAQLQKIAANQKAMLNRFNNPNAPNVVHSRMISCRFYKPEAKTYEIHEMSTTCAIQSLCSGMPNVENVRDGDPLDWSSPVGVFVKTQNKITDVSNWSCWLRTQ